MRNFLEPVVPKDVHASQGCTPGIVQGNPFGMQDKKIGGHLFLLNSNRKRKALSSTNIQN